MSIQRSIEKKISSNRKLVKKLKKLARNFGFNLEYWHRYITYKQIKKDINFLNMESFDVLEISAGEYWKENYKFKLQMQVLVLQSQEMAMLLHHLF